MEGTRGSEKAHRTQLCIALEPLKSRHKGDWLYFSAPSGADLLPM